MVNKCNQKALAHLSGNTVENPNAFRVSTDRVRTVLGISP